jgi:hypothetical protein
VHAGGGGPGPGRLLHSLRVVAPWSVAFHREAALAAVTPMR